MGVRPGPSGEQVSLLRCPARREDPEKAAVGALLPGGAEPSGPRRRSRPPFAAARRRARRAPASSPGALRSPRPAPRAQRGPAAVTRRAARGRLALRFVEPGDGRGLLTCGCGSRSDRRWELLVEPAEVKVSRPAGPGTSEAPGSGLRAAGGLPWIGVGKGPDRPETLL